MKFSLIHKLKEAISKVLSLVPSASRLVTLLKALPGARHIPAPAKIGQLWVRQAESGLSVTIQGIYYILLLFTFFAVVYDIGNAGYVATISTNAVRVAAQDAAKHIDELTFIETQEVRLSPDALGRAQDVVNGLTGGKVAILQVKVTSLQKHDVIMILGHAHAALPVMGAVFGIDDVIIPVEAYAEPAYGISLEGQ